ncbi:hypothetical protein, partial [Bacillus cereus]|uniref:hypothetical protein n=1 Tax=Bacillus cereus TaxID=1396 RepID=UPI003012F21D
MVYYLSVANDGIDFYRINTNLFRISIDIKGCKMVRLNLSTKSSLKTKQNVKRQFLFLKLDKLTLLESLILAQDERWRRA